MPEKPPAFSRSIENLIAAFRELPEDEGRSRPRRTVELGALVDELLVKYRIGNDAVEHRLRDRWAELVGPANAAYSHPVALERGQLLVLVSHAVVRSELFQHRAAILERLRRVPGCAEIRGLVLRTGG